MKNAKRKMRTWIKEIVLSCLIFQTAAVSSQEFTMPSFVHAIDACDMDMDGSVDIIASCAYEDSVVILFNDGYGSFEPYYFGRTTGYLLCGCIDGDSIPDIVTTTNNLNFIKNYGDRTLADSSIILIEDITFPIERIIDMNDDGWNDIVYDCDNYWGILKNNGDLTFINILLDSDGGGPAQPSFGFMNSDSLPDVLISYSYVGRASVTKYLINESNFNFIEFTLNSNNYKPNVSNLNNIFPDDLLLFYTPTPEVHMYENIGNSKFVSHDIHHIVNTAGVYFQNCADYNLDSYDDFSYTQCFWSGCTDSLYVELNSQNWSFKPAQQYYIGTLNSFIINSIDLNGDLFPDFYMTGYNSNNKIKILWNNGDGTFSYNNPVGIKEPNYNKDFKIDVNPNPFSSSTNIKFTCLLPAIVSIKIYNIQGIEIQSLMVDQKIVSGDYQIIWDGTNYSGSALSPGVYVIILRINGLSSSCKIIHY